MQFNVYDVLYSQCYCQHVSAITTDIFRVMLLQEHKVTDAVNSVAITP